MTNGVHLRDVAAADLPIFYEQQLDPDATRMAAFPTRSRETFMAHWKWIMNDETIAKQTILLDGQIAGNIVCWKEAGKRLVGYWLGQAYWGKGVATKALAAFLGQVQARPISAHVAKHNVASLRVLEKCGFTISDKDTAIPTLGVDEAEEVVLILR